MSTENETWRDASSSEENSGAGRDGNQFNREGSYSRPSYNRENGDRPYRPRFNSENGDRPQRSYSSDRPYRQRFNPNAENGDRPQRSYNNDRSYRPRYNSEGGDRPQRSYGNNAGGDRPYRPRYNSEGGDRSQRPYGNNAGGDRPFRPRYNSNGDRPQRPYGNRDSYSRPIRRTGDYDPNAKYSKKKQIEYKEQFVDPNEPIRLNKFLANAGICSRREADEYITAGVVSVNGEVCTMRGKIIRPGDKVTVEFEDATVEVEVGAE